MNKKNYVRVEAYVLSDMHGWDHDTVWIPREVAMAVSQDAFIKWVNSDEGEECRRHHGNVYALFLSDFSFDERGTFAEKGSRVRIARTTENGPRQFEGKIGYCGVLQEHARIGEDTCPLDMVDILLDNGNEVTVMSHLLDFENASTPQKGEAEDLTPEQVVALGQEIYQTFFEETVTFEGAVGRDLSYLMGAILKGSYCTFGGTTTMMKFLRAHFPLDHQVWSFIKTEQA